MRVLLVDGSSLFYARFSELLADLPGIGRVEHARSAREGEAALARIDPDLVVLALELPGMGALRLLETIRGHVRAPAVVVLCNSPSSVSRDHCLAAGADFFFDKTTEIDLVLDQIGRLGSGLL